MDNIKELFPVITTIIINLGMARIFLEERRDKIFWTLRMKRIEFLIRRLFVIVLISILIFGMGALAQSVNVAGVYVSAVITLISLLYIFLISKGIKNKKKDEWFVRLLKHDLMPFTFFTYSYLYFAGYITTVVFTEKFESQFNQPLLEDVVVPLFIWLMIIFVAFYMVAISHLFDPLFRIKKVVYFVKVGSIEYRIDGTLSNGMIAVSEGDDDKFIPKKEDFFYDKKICMKEANRYWERS